MYTHIFQFLSLTVLAAVVEDGLENIRTQCAKHITIVLDKRGKTRDAYDNIKTKAHLQLHNDND